MPTHIYQPAKRIRNVLRTLNTLFASSERRCGHALQQVPEGGLAAAVEEPASRVLAAARPIAAAAGFVNVQFFNAGFVAVTPTPRNNKARWKSASTMD